MTPPAWRIGERRGRAGLVSLETDWRRLYLSMPRRMSCHLYETHLAYVDQLMERPDRLRCFTLSDGREVRAICLLEAKRDSLLGLPLPIWRVPLPNHMPFGDVIAPEDDARRAFLPMLIGHLRRKSGGRLLLHLGPLPADSRLWAGLSGLSAGSYCLDAGESVDIIDCGGSIDDILAKLSRKFRENLRRCGRKLAAFSNVRHVRAVDEVDLEREFQAFLALEASGWKGKAGTAIACQPRQPAFFHGLLSIRGPDDHCEINALYADSRCIASSICMRTGAEYAGLRIAYDERYAQLSPAHLLLAEVLKQCCLDPSVTHMNWVAHSAWQQSWRPRAMPMQCAYLGLGQRSEPSLMALVRLRLGPARALVRSARTWQTHIRELRSSRRTAE